MAPMFAVCFWATPDMVAMESMSAGRTAWMTAVFFCCTCNSCNPFACFSFRKTWCCEGEPRGYEWM